MPAADLFTSWVVCWLGRPNLQQCWRQAVYPLCPSSAPQIHVEVQAAFVERFGAFAGELGPQAMIGARACFMLALVCRSSSMLVQLPAIATVRPNLLRVHAIMLPQAGRTTRSSFLSWPALRPRCLAWLQRAAAGLAASAKPRAAAASRAAKPAMRNAVRQQPASPAAAMRVQPCLIRHQLRTRRQQRKGGQCGGHGGGPLLHEVHRRDGTWCLHGLLL